MTVIVLDIPFPPSVNNLFLNQGRGRVRSPQYRAWSEEAGWAVKAQKPKIIVGPYELDLTIGKPDRRKRDISNLIKAPEDLIVELGIVSDDSNCQAVSARWGQVQGCRVVIREAVPDTWQSLGEAAGKIVEKLADAGWEGGK